MATIPELFATAIQHHQNGQLPAAEQLYRQILQVDPQHADATHLLGLIAHQVGQHQVAVSLITRSVQLDGTAANVHNNLGGVYRALGRLQEAAASYRTAVRLKPTYAQAHANLGIVLADQGMLDEAVPCYRRAIQLQPDFVDAYVNLADALKNLGRLDEAIATYQRILELLPNEVEHRGNLGNLFRQQGKLDEAIACYRQVIAMKPDNAVAHLNLGIVLNAQHQTDEAIASYHRALELNPAFPEAHNNLGNALKNKGQLNDAVACYRRALELAPTLTDALNNLGNAYYDLGKLDEAVPYYRRALEIQPNYAQGYRNLGVVLYDQMKLDEAVECYRRAIELEPNNASAHSYLGTVLKWQGKLDEAAECCRRAIQLNPHDAGGYNNLGNALKDQGKLEEAIACYRKATELEPDNGTVHSNLVYTQIFCPGYDSQALLNELRQWNRAQAEPLAKFIQPHNNDPNVNRRIRVGYVSPDFRNHVVGRNLLPLFREHDHQQFEIVCYASMPKIDELTRVFQGHADLWRHATGMNDEQLADLIRQDQIDILVDLTLHMACNRLKVFARKPAPVQVTFAGYPGSTGLTAIDYRLTDRYLDPPESYDADYSEESIQLEDSFWRYDPLDSEIDVNDLPALQTGYVTFGCLNNFCKLNPPILKIWAQILRAVPNSRLMLLAGEGLHRDQTRAILVNEGIQADRIIFMPNQPRKQYLKTYHQIDLGLDTIPYNGHTTSLDSYWMAVPVVTLVGPTIVGRAGLCQLMNLGLPELITRSPEQFVEVCVQLANDLPRLREIRATLRERMRTSPLMDHPGFARKIEAAYREMWRRWCDAQRNESQ